MKKRIAAILLLLCVTLTAHAVGARITLDSGKSMPNQIRDFKAWYQNLSAKEQAQWDEAFEEIRQDSEQRAALASLAEDNSGEQMVWIPKSGKKYHKISSCSNMKNPTQVPLSTALSRGYTPCKKCKP